MYRRGIIEFSDKERNFLCSCIEMSAREGFYNLPDDISIDEIDLRSLVYRLDPTSFTKWIKELKFDGYFC